MKSTMVKRIMTGALATAMAVTTLAAPVAVSATENATYPGNSGTIEYFYLHPVEKDLRLVNPINNVDVGDAKVGDMPYTVELRKYKVKELKNGKKKAEFLIRFTRDWTPTTPQISSLYETDLLNGGVSTVVVDDKTGYTLSGSGVNVETNWGWRNFENYQVGTSQKIVRLPRNIIARVTVTYPKGRTFAVGAGAAGTRQRTSAMTDFYKGKIRYHESPFYKKRDDDAQTGGFYDMHFKFVK